MDDLARDQYVLITPARDEEAYIEETLRSVIAQTIQPREWVIVNDGSRDRTAEIVGRYEKHHDFIRLLRLSDRPERNFASRVFAFDRGYKALQCRDYQFIGNLDADIRLERSYYEQILAKFRDNERLGLAGGQVYEKVGKKIVSSRNSKESVAGAVQLFRRQCLEAIDGYIPLPSGGDDAIAEVMARMKGWETQTFREIPVYHLKPSNSAMGNIVVAKWQLGERDYLIGNHPLFQLARCLFRCFERPYVLSSLFRMAGYLRLWAKGSQRSISPAIVVYKQAEQIKRLRSILRGTGT